MKLFRRSMTKSGLCCIGPSCSRDPVSQYFATRYRGNLDLLLYIIYSTNKKITIKTPLKKQIQKSPLSEENTISSDCEPLPDGSSGSRPALTWTSRQHKGAHQLDKHHKLHRGAKAPHRSLTSTSFPIVPNTLGQARIVKFSL